MDIKDTKTWPGLAGERLKNAPQSGKITGIYTGLTLGASLGVSLVVWALDLAVADTGGLGDFGRRSLLMTLQSILPLGLNLLLLVLDLGFTGAMLRVSRGQYASPNALRLGLDRFWVLLRATLALGLVYLGVGLPVAYLALAVYMLTPWGDGVVQAMLPMILESSLTEEGYSQIAQAMEPCVVVCGIAMALAVLAVSYRYRMVSFVLLDKPGTGALAALRESRAMMKGNCLRLFRLDLRLWWYYAGLVLSRGAEELSRFLPWPEEVGSWVSYGLSLAILGLTYIFARSRAEVAYGFAYDSLRPKQPQSGVVLGNIFQM